MNKPNEGTVKNAKKIVAVLNEVKSLNQHYSQLADLTKVLKLKGCPYPASVVSYLRRQNFLVRKGDWYIFTSSTPFDFYNFIVVVDRIKQANNRSSKKHRTQTSKIKEEVRPIPKIKKFLIKLFFGVKV